MTLHRLSASPSSPRHSPSRPTWNSSTRKKQTGTAGQKSRERKRHNSLADQQSEKHPGCGLFCYSGYIESPRGREVRWNTTNSASLNHRRSDRAEPHGASKAKSRCTLLGGKPLPRCPYILQRTTLKYHGRGWRSRPAAFAYDGDMVHGFLCTNSTRARRPFCDFDFSRLECLAP